MVNVETAVFTLDELSCTFKANATNGKGSPSFRLKKGNKAKVDRPELRNGEIKAIILLCGPVPEDCPITEAENFLKKVCLEDFGTTVLQCPYSKTVYTSAVYPVPPEQIITLSTICENDPNFYQSCGVRDSTTYWYESAVSVKDAAICGDFICTAAGIETPRGHTLIKNPYQLLSATELCKKKEKCSGNAGEPCRGENILRGCGDLKLPEDFCSTENETMQKLPTGLMAPKSKVCNGRCDVHYRCEDEAVCNGLVYGTYCRGYGNTLQYIKPSDLCDGMSSYSCLNNEERDCPDVDSQPELEKCHKSSPPFSLTPISITNRTRCTAPWKDLLMNMDHILDSLCSNFLDQTNCSDPSRSTVVCPINGFRSTVSKFFVCHGQTNLPALCDNGMDQVCSEVQVSLTCSLHKHQLCDEIRDCPDGSDESLAICRSMANRKCLRAYIHKSKLRIPLAWLRDGVEDCLDGLDERDIWPSCGEGRTQRFVASETSTCGEVFLCSHERAGFVQFQDLCDGIGSCGNEKSMCDKSHLAIPTLNKAVISMEKTEVVEKLLFYCLPGLESLQNEAESCVHHDIGSIGMKVFGIKDLSIVIPDRKINCDYIFGAIYLILSCAGLCKNSICPIRSKMEHNSCPGQFSNRVYTVADNKFLSFVTKSRDGYKNDYFLCDNGFCIRYDQVCNLIDECGDGSDEDSCTNVLKCDSGKQLIPISEKCDGKIDCSDSSDECNSECGRDILQSIILKFMCWFLALLATVLNIASVIRCVSKFNFKMSIEALNDKMFILLINVGDLLVGIYLLQIAIMDSIVYRGSYCKNQVSWLSSSHCNILGVISTIGHEFSLGSVTVLALARAIALRNGLKISKNITRRSILKIACKALTIIALSSAIALTPLMPQLEDFFVNGMTYAPFVRLFIGSPGKEIHMNIVQEYYGKVKEKSLNNWRVINELVDNMFSHDYMDNAIGRKKLEFYGNEGVCLFKFFVKAGDPQRNYAWLVLIINMISLGIISACYIFINVNTRANSHALTREKTPMKERIQKRNKKLQRKISLIIGTDLLCWLPVTVVSCLHSAEILVATPYYPLISIVFLPINSVINPVLYNDIFIQALKNHARRLWGSSNSQESRDQTENRESQKSEAGSLSHRQDFAHQPDLTLQAPLPNGHGLDLDLVPVVE